MEKLFKQDAYDAPSKVRLFLDTLAVLDGKPPNEESLVARLCSSLLLVFRDTIQRVDGSKLPEEEDKPSVSISLRRSLDRLRLWSDGYGICAGDQDVNFSKSRRLRRATTETLINISDTVLERLEPMISSKKTEISKTAEESRQRLRDVLEEAHGDVDHYASSSDSGSDYGFDSLSEIEKDLETDTTCLMGLDALFQSVASDSPDEKAAFADKAQIWLPHHVYKDKIQTRFPQAEGSLILRLSKASYDRYLRCQGERQNRTAEVDNADILPITRSEASSKFHDSGLGTSIPSSASIAETVMSYQAGGGRSVKVPPLSKEAKEGQPFECLSCGKLLSIRNNSAWKQHLYKDLLPWQCLDTACSFTTVFGTREDWIAHIAYDHKLEPDWFPITCPLCLDTTASGKIAITKHLCNHLEEISLAGLPVNLDLESDSGSEGDSALSESQEGSTYEKNEKKDPPKENPNTSNEDPGLIKQDALKYLDEVKLAFHDRPDIYNQFLDLMKDFNLHVIDTPGLMHQIRDLFVGTNDGRLILDFNRFLPHGYSIDNNLNLRFPDRETSTFETDRPKAQPTGGDAILVSYLDNGRDPEIHRLASPETLPVEQSIGDDPAENPVSFNTAMDYVNRVKSHYQNEPDVYREFLTLLQSYQAKNMPITDVTNAVTKLFASTPKLVEDFRMFLPDISGRSKDEFKRSGPGPT